MERKERPQQRCQGGGIYPDSQKEKRGAVTAHEKKNKKKEKNTKKEKTLLKIPAVTGTHFQKAR